MGREETYQQVTRVEHMTVHATCAQKKICKSGGASGKNSPTQEGAVCKEDSRICVPGLWSEQRTTSQMVRGWGLREEKPSLQAGDTVSTKPVRNSDTHDSVSKAWLEAKVLTQHHQAGRLPLPAPLVSPRRPRRQSLGGPIPCHF